MKMKKTEYKELSKLVSLSFKKPKPGAKPKISSNLKDGVISFF